MVKHMHCCLRSVLRLCTAFALVFSIMLGACANDVQAGQTDITYQTETEYLNLYGHSTSSPGLGEFEGSVFESYSVESSAKYFRLYDGNNFFFDPSCKYYVQISVSGYCNPRAYYPASADVHARLYIILNGEKHYFNGNVLTLLVSDVATSVYSLGVEFDVSVRDSYQYNSALKEYTYASNFAAPVYTIDSLSYHIVRYDGTLSLSASDLMMYNAIQQGNNLQQNSSSLQQQGNQLQQESNNLQQQENQLQQNANELQAEANETSKGILGSITDFFGSFFQNFINAIVSVFVPESGYFEDFFGRLNNFFSEKLGMLYAPIDMFITFLSSISSSAKSRSGNTGLTFPEVRWQGYTIIEEQTIDLQGIAGQFSGLQDAVYFGTDVMMVGAVLVLLQNKLKEMLTS